MRTIDKERLRQVYVFRCGYCGITEVEAGTRFTADHFQPQSQGGTSALNNLVYACHTCNEFKGDWWNPDGEQRILHPLNDNLGEHIALQQDGTLLGLSSTGVFHIEQLHLNRWPLIVHRREQLEQQQRDAQETMVLARPAQIEQAVAVIMEMNEELRRRLP